jgi:hypothetical protein
MINITKTEFTHPAIVDTACSGCIHSEVCKYSEEQNSLMERISAMLKENENSINDVHIRCKKFVDKSSTPPPWHGTRDVIK